MIRVTGDTHGDPVRFIENNMGDNEWTSEDYLIVCGDFGFVFRNNESEKAFLDYLEREKPYTICFCDGNHENFPAIFAYPEEEWHGGRVHRIRNNVIHLMRGQVYDIEGKSFFVFGGAYSIDRGWRTEGVSWWPEEQPTEEERAIGMDNLQKRDFAVDYIITHTAPQALVERLIAKQPWFIRADFEMSYRDHKLMGYLGEVMHKTTFQHWYFGHWHFDTPIDDHSTAVYYHVHTL